MTAPSEAVLIAVIAAAPGLLAALATLSQSRRTARRMGGVEHELRPNSGGSLRDAVDRIEQTQRVQAADIGSIRSDQRETRRELGDVRNDVSDGLRDHLVIRREWRAELGRHVDRRHESASRHRSEGDTPPPA